jgi:hypothetical protein
MRSAYQTLSDELDAAKAALADAERSAREAALSVMSEEAGRIAERLDAAKREMWALSNKLRGLAQIWLPSGTNQTLKPTLDEILPMQLSLIRWYKKAVRSWAKY